MLPENFEEALKKLVAAPFNAEPEEAGVWAGVLTKQVGSRTAPAPLSGCGIITPGRWPLGPRTNR
jgi:hypothetical protein